MCAIKIKNNKILHLSHYLLSLLLQLIQPKEETFLKNGPFPASFSLFSSFQYTVESKQMFNINKYLPMTGFEPRTSDI